MPLKVIRALAKEIVSAPLKPIYMFSGEDNYRKNLALAEIKKRVAADDFNIMDCEADKMPAAEIISGACTAPVFSDTRLVIVRNAEKLKADGRAAFVEYAGNPMPTTCMVILSEEKKKEDPLGKACEKAGIRIIFGELRESEAEGFVKDRLAAERIAIDGEALSLLIETVGADAGALAAETEKLALLGSAKIEKGHVIESLGFSKDENPFDLSNAIFDRDVRRAAKLIDRLLESGENPVQLLAIISAAIVKLFKARRLAAAGVGGQRLFAESGLHPWYNKNTVAGLNYFPSEKALQDVLRRVLETEAAFKTSSADNASSALKALVIRAVGGK